MSSAPGDRRLGTPNPRPKAAGVAPVRILLADPDPAIEQLLRDCGHEPITLNLTGNIEQQINNADVLLANPDTPNGRRANQIARTLQTAAPGDGCRLPACDPPRAPHRYVPTDLMAQPPHSRSAR